MPAERAPPKSSASHPMNKTLVIATATLERPFIATATIVRLVSTALSPIVKILWAID